jgi:hypothetical protein
LVLEVSAGWASPSSRSLCGGDALPLATLLDTEPNPERGFRSVLQPGVADTPRAPRAPRAPPPPAAARRCPTQAAPCPPASPSWPGPTPPSAAAGFLAGRWLSVGAPGRPSRMTPRRSSQRSWRKVRQTTPGSLSFRQQLVGSPDTRRRGTGIACVV